MSTCWSDGWWFGQLHWLGTPTTPLWDQTEPRLPRRLRDTRATGFDSVYYYCLTFIDSHLRRRVLLPSITLAAVFWWLSSFSILLIGSLAFLIGICYIRLSLLGKVLAVWFDLPQFNTSIGCVIAKHSRLCDLWVISLSLIIIRFMTLIVFYPSLVTLWDFIVNIGQ